MKIFQVDAFTSKPFSGNPAAVCILAESRPDAWMLKVAAEMNLSETAFLLQHERGFDLRWFTPKVEVDLCGHATLASAHILWEQGYLKPDEQARFHTRSGLLTAEKKGEWIELNFPAEPESETPPPKELLQGLSVTPLYVGKNRMDYLVEVASEAEVRSLNPDLALLAKLPVRGIMVTSKAASKDYDFISRFFGPSAGIDEDPVTGSAHCCLGPYWMEKLNKKEFTAYQASSRGGVIKVRVEGERVYLGGQAVTVLEGNLLT